MEHHRESSVRRVSRADWGQISLIAAVAAALIALLLLMMLLLNAGPATAAIRVPIPFWQV